MLAVKVREQAHIAAMNGSNQLNADGAIIQHSVLCEVGLFALGL